GKPTALDPPSPGPLSNYAFPVDMEAEYREAYIGGPRATMAAYACDPMMPVGDQKITAITIKSNNVLTTTNGTFAAGQDITSVFVVMFYGGTYDITGII